MATIFGTVANKTLAGESRVAYVTQGMTMRKLGLFISLLALVAHPAVAASSPGMVSLERQISSLVGARPGEYGVAALDLQDGTMLSVNGDTPFPMASTVKVAIAATYLTQVDHGQRTMGDMIGSRSAAKLMELMLIHSDNIATDQLLVSLGGPATVQAWLRWNGLTGIRIDRTIAQLLRSPRDLRDVRDSATPMAMIALLRQIDKGNVLQPASRSILLDLMARCATGSNRIRSLLPYGTRVENKTGTLNGLTGDIGFITMPDGRRVAVALFARGGSERQRGIAVAARAIYDRFSRSVGNSFSMILPGR